MAKPSLLKNAIQSLELHRPYNLKGQTQTLKPPAPTAPTAPKQEPETIPTTELEHTENEHAQIEYAQPKKVKSQPSKPVVSVEAKPDESTQKHGFFKLAHAGVYDERLRNLSGDSFRVFIFLSLNAWRFTQNRGEVRASVNYVSKISGVSRSTATRCLESLEEAKLLVMLEQDYKRGNLWRVSDLLSFRAGAENEHAQNGDTQIEQGACSKSVRSILKMNTEHAHFEHHNKNYNNSKNSQLTRASEETPSVQKLEVEKYLDEVLPPRKRDTERACFSELMQAYKVSQIDLAFRYVRENGTLNDGTACHSPMAYLAVSIQAVLNKLAMDQAKNEKHASDLASRRSTEAALEQEIHDAEVAYEEAKKAFNEAFSSLESQQRQIATFSENFPTLDPLGKVVRKLAIQNWYRSRNKKSL